MSDDYDSIWFCVRSYDYEGCTAYFIQAESMAAAWEAFAEKCGYTMADLRDDYQSRCTGWGHRDYPDGGFETGSGSYEVMTLQEAIGRGEH